MILNKQHKIMRFENGSIKTFMVTLLVASAILMSLIVSLNSVECAPASNNSKNGNSNNNNNNKSSRPSLLSQLFRRQTSSGSNDNNGSSSSDNDDQPTQTELDAQKFMDSLPNVGASNNPSSFRERMSDTFGLLRDGVNNHFRSFRENWSDTMEDLRDTWSGSNSD